MYLGPIHPTLPGLSTGHSPVKPIKVATDVGKQTVLFDQDYGYALQAQPVDIDAQTVVYEATQALAIARITQMLEMAQNAEWQRAGLFVQWREDGVSDPEDGWYIIKAADISEEFLFSAYAEPQIQLELRQRQRQSIGIYVDQKQVPNDQNGNGTALAAVPMGLTVPYPAATWTFAGSNGNILAVENPIAVMRGLLTTPVTVMTQGRCRVNDQNSGRTTVTEVFWKDHRNINGQWEFSNDLLRYYFAEGTTPTVDVWTGAAWTTVGTYQLQTANGGTVLPVQTVQLVTVSPEEVVWTERRFDSGGNSLVVVQNRIRRGSRMIESQIVAASGAGLTGTLSVAVVASSGTWTGATTVDGSGAVFTDSGSTRVVGFGYLTAPPNPASVSTLTLGSGLAVPAGTVGRIGLFFGYQDAMFGTFAGPAAPAAPTLSTIGTAGLTSYSYALIAQTAPGGADSAQGTVATITTGNATLSATNEILITLPALPSGATSWKVLRTASGGSPSSTGLIATGVTGGTFTDPGIAAVANTPFTQAMTFMTRWAAYNRMRVRQRILVGLTA